MNFIITQPLKVFFELRVLCGVSRRLTSREAALREHAQTATLQSMRGEEIV